MGDIRLEVDERVAGGLMLVLINYTPLIGKCIHLYFKTQGCVTVRQLFGSQIGSCCSIVIKSVTSNKHEIYVH